MARRRRAQRCRQQPQGDGQIPFHIAVGEQVLVHHHRLDGGFAQGDDGSARRPRRRWIPGGAAAGQQDQVGLLQIRRRLRPQVQRVALGEIGGAGGAFHYRNGEGFRQRHQVMEPGGFTAGAVGDNQGRFTLRHESGQLGDVLRGGLRFRRLGNRAQFARRRPGVDHRFNGDVQEGRPLGDALRQFAGAGHLAVEGGGAGGLPAPLGYDVRKAMGAAHHAEAAIPLGLRVQFRVLAVAGGFPGADQHRHFAQAGAVDAHAALEQAHAGVEQHGLHPSGDAGVACGHIHRQGFVPAVDVARPRGFVEALARQRFPHRRPLGAGRGYDVVHPQVAERFQDGLAPVRPLLRSSRHNSGSSPADGVLNPHLFRFIRWLASSACLAAARFCRSRARASGRPPRGCPRFPAGRGLPGGWRPPAPG